MFKEQRKEMEILLLVVTYCLAPAFAMQVKVDHDIGKYSGTFGSAWTKAVVIVKLQENGTSKDELTEELAKLAQEILSETGPTTEAKPVMNKFQLKAVVKTKLNGKWVFKPIYQVEVGPSSAAETYYYLAEFNQEYELQTDIRSSTNYKQILAEAKPTSLDKIKEITSKIRACSLVQQLTSSPEIVEFTINRALVAVGVDLPDGALECTQVLLEFIKIKTFG